MAHYTITVMRTYRDGEIAEVRIEAATPEAALARAMRIERDRGFDNWRAYDGSDIECYRWEVFSADDGDKRHCLLTAYGSLDREN